MLKSLFLHWNAICSLFDVLFLCHQFQKYKYRNYLVKFPQRSVSCMSSEHTHSFSNIHEIRDMEYEELGINHLKQFFLSRSSRNISNEKCPNNHINFIHANDTDAWDLSMHTSSEWLMNCLMTNMRRTRHSSKLLCDDAAMSDIKGISWSFKFLNYYGLLMISKQRFGWRGVTK